MVFLLSGSGELAELIREHIEVERQSVARLAETEKKVGTGVAKLLLAEMRMDSQKHAGLLEAVLETLKNDLSSKDSWQRAFDGFVDPAMVRREIEYHKGLEKSMSTHFVEETSKTDDEAIRTLLQHLAEDEKRHHEILDTIARKCYAMIR